MAIFKRGSKTTPTRGEIISALRQENQKILKYIERNIGVPIPDMKDAKDYTEVGSKKVWASFRACHLTASFFLSTEFFVRGKTNGAYIENPELQRLMSSPNPFDSWEELLYQWVFHMKLTGNAFWLKDEMDSRGRPKNIYPLIPQYLKIYPHETDRIGYYEYGTGGNKVRFEKDEVIIFRRPHPARSIGGLGDVEGGESLFKEYLMRNQVEERFMANGAMPSGILSKKDAIEDQTQWEKFKAWWDQKYSGTKNAGKTAMLNGEWSYTKLGLTHQEMQSLESDKWTINEIFICHGVPLSIAGIENAANLATARQEEINFRKYEIVPLVDIFVGKLNSDNFGLPALIGSFNDNWEMSYEMSGLIDVEGVVKDYRPIVEIGGMTLNELREMCGLSRIENPLLDQFMTNNSRVPLEIAGYVDTGAADDMPVGEQPEEEEDIQRTALNGAQITSLQAILSDVVMGQSSPELARATIEAAFPAIPADVLDAVVREVGRVKPVDLEKASKRQAAKMLGKVLYKAGIIQAGD